MIYEVTKVIYLFVLLFASFCAAYKYKKLDTASKILAVLVCSAFINESAAYYMAKKYHNNLQLYTIYSMLEFGILSLYFNKVIDVFVRRNIGIYIGVLGIVLGILNLIFIQPFSSINSYFLLFEGLATIGMALFAFFRFLLERDWLNLRTYHHFWFISILLFFWSITFLTWGLYDYINQKLMQSAVSINTTLLIVSAITYGSLGYVFLLYHKMKKA